MPIPSSFPVVRYRLEATTERPIRLPEYAGSALRGAFGHALKRVACVTGLPDCTSCALYRSCPCPAIFESPPPLNYPRRTMSKVPHPFVVEPPPWGERDYAAGSTLTFGVVLIGPALQHLPLVLLAWREALQKGLGPNVGTALLDRVFAERLTEPVLAASGGKLGAHVKQCPLPPPEAAAPATTLNFETPLRLQRQGRVLGVDRITAHDLLMALLRRVANLTELQLGGQLDVDFAALNAHARTITDSRQLQWRDWTRQSSRQQQRMVLGGVVGRWTLHGDLRPFWPMLHLGQWLHIGKNATFGLGRYHLEDAT